jgi:hypothetical protein
MIFRTRAPLAIAAAALLALSACESATNSRTAPEGSVAFTFSGDTAGSYNATGRFNRLRPDIGTFAVGASGTISSGEEALAVFAQSTRASNATLFDQFLLSVENPDVGSITCAAGEETCPFGAILFLGADATGETDNIFTSVSGTVNITSISNDRARGTFSFALEGFGADLEEEPRAMQITSGTFDVPIVQDL